MSGRTNAPSLAFALLGLIIPAESDILAGVLTGMSAAFGGNLDTGLSTPQGQFVFGTAAAIGDKNAAILALT